MKRFLHYLFAFLIPISIFLFAMYLMDLYPFGDTSIRISDANIQYPAFFEGLKNFDLFTFKIGLGANFYTIFTTYLASPLSFLYLFFENYQFDIFFVILVLLKIGLIGLNMNILLNYKKVRNKHSLVFSTIYALSGFVTLYYWNYQFLDALYMLPLIMIGIDKLVNDNKNLMYFITLTLMIIFHYYTAYMICIFSVIYFFFLLINSELNKKDKKKRIIKFFITSLFCGLCSSFITIPSVHSFIHGRANYNYNINYFGFNKDFFSSFYNLCGGTFFTIDFGNTSAPIFVTLFIIVSIILLFFDKNINKTYKWSVFFVIIIYLVSLLFNFIYYGWHLFNQPQGLPGRFVFCFNCFFVLISYKHFFNINSVKRKSKIIVLFFLILLIFLSFVYKINLLFFDFKSIDKRYIILLIFNLFLIFYYVFFEKNTKTFLLTIFLIFLELLINLICSFNVNFALYDYRNLNIHKERTIVKELNSLIKNEYDYNEDDFYRNEYYSQFNYGMFLNYNAVSYYSSVYNNNLIEFLGDYNDYKDVSYVVGYGGNYLLNGLLGIKNIYSYDEDKIFCLKNNYYLKSLGYMIKENHLINSQITDNTIIDVYNNMTLGNVLGIKKMIPKIYYENVILNDNNFQLIDNKLFGKVIIEYTLKENALIDFDYKPVYYMKKNNDKKYNATEIIDLYVNNIKVTDVLYLNKNDVFKIVINISSEIESIPISYNYLNYVNYDIYGEKIEELNKNIIENIEINKIGFTGSINVTSDKKLLVLTIPFDENINIFIDNKNINYKKIYNGIIGVNLDEGKHLIELKYSVKGLKMGIIISLSSVLIFVFIKILEKLKIYRYNYIDNKEEI